MKDMKGVFSEPISFRASRANQFWDQGLPLTSSVLVSEETSLWSLSQKVARVTW